MAKVRSPNFPSMDLGSALVLARKAYDRDRRKKMSREALGKHLGHESLSGPALSKIGALRAYGLVDGSGDELRISDDAITAMMAPQLSSERHAALARLFAQPALFQDIAKEFVAAPREENLRYWLIKRDYTPEAAGKALRAYLVSFRLVNGTGPAYDAFASEETAEEPEMPQGAPVSHRDAPQRRDDLGPVANRILDEVVTSVQYPKAKSPMLQEIFNLDEGPVTLSFPSDLSQDSYEDLKDQLELFLRRAQRRATGRSLTRDSQEAAAVEKDVS